MAELRRQAALVLFAVLAMGAPLAFGLVDAPWQIAACAIFAVGLLLWPPLFPAPSRRTLLFWLAVAGLLLVKEVLPATWFGAMSWRTALGGAFGLRLPVTHHPEIGRAVDGWLVILLAVIWFSWVRTLVRGGGDARLLGWLLIGAGALLALVCFAMSHDAAAGIYRVRPTPGWTGFGPFPNRNHTADFLAMSAVLGLGLLVREYRHGARWRAALVAALELLILLALLASNSRGGLIAGGIGLLTFCLFQIIERGGRKTILAAVTGLLLASSALLMVGGPLLARFQDANEAGISNANRVAIWKNTLEMVETAPVFGFGLGTFAPIFPQYEHLDLEGEVVRHPESSWLQLVVEAGGAITLLLAAGLGVVMTRQARSLRKNEQGFDLRAAAFSAVVVILIHALWDVPAHRWGTAAYGLAALALACPLRSRETAPARPGAAVLPLLAAALWFCGLHWQWPRWTPTALDSLLARENVSRPRAGLADLQAAERAFPLSPELHFGLGARALRTPGGQDEAYHQFRLAAQLKSSSWTLPAAVAALCAADSPGMARYFWTLAMDRAGHRREELFMRVFEQVQARAKARGNDAALQPWLGYADAHPELLLTVAQRLPEEAGRACYERWWKLRGAEPALETFELRAFANLLARFGRAEQLTAWRAARPKLEATQFRPWAAALHAWGRDAEAWKLLTAHMPEPEVAALKTTKTPDLLEARWMRVPDDFMNAQLLAVAWLQQDRQKAGERVILQTARLVEAPVWFLRKAAYLQWRAGQPSEAVALLLREK